ncbi:MAG: class I SAM-dependent methyltransferase [Roseivirga sp.]|nr:class I SAM-dependent methyltransferase [Roseivirga sp.]
MPVTITEFESIKESLSRSGYAKKNYTVRHGQKGYWKYRISRPFLKARYSKFCKANPETPWLTPDAIIALNQLLKPDFVALEYGSGRSTLFFSQKVEKLYSVEHHEEWYNHVKQLLAEKEVKNTSLNLIKPDKILSEIKLSSELQMFISEEDYPNKDNFFDKYVEYINSFDNDFFDFVLVDGRARKSCALVGVDKLKSGGLLVLDNSERLRYKAVHDTLKDWPRLFTTTGLTDTTIWLKP